MKADFEKFKENALKSSFMVAILKRVICWVLSSEFSLSNNHVQTDRYTDNWVRKDYAFYDEIV